MQPQQTPNNNDQFNNPPQTQSGGQPPQYPPQQASQPNPQYQNQGNPQTPPYQQPGQQYGPQPQQQAQQHPEWYKAPEPTKKDTAPSKASDYVSRANTPPTQQGQLVNGQYSVDYLSNMSGAAPNKISKKMIAILGGAIALVLTGAVALILATPQQTVASATISDVYSIMADTQDVTDDANDNIRNSKLKGLNSSLDSVLISTMQKLESPLESRGEKASTLRSNARKAPNADAEIREKLEEARLHVMFDEVYLMQINFKVAEILRQIEYVYERTNSEEARSALEDGRTNLTGIKESLDGFEQAEDSGIL